MMETAASADISDEFFLPDFGGDATGAAVHGLSGFAVEGESGRAEDDEEELEWLANKDAFPAVETSFDPSAESWSSAAGGGGGSGGGSGGERLSPVSVLAAALPFRAPARSRSQGRRRRRNTLPCFTASSAGSPPPPAAPPQVLPGTAVKAGKRMCRHCGAEETPQWRTGPEGPKTLCNACGVRFKSGRLVPEYRPANSPTFSPAIHSNFHRKVVEMRRRNYGGSGPVSRGRRSERRRRPSACVVGKIDF